MNKMELELIETWKKMADHTQPECAKCKPPLSCCQPMFCELAKDHAKEHWGTILENTAHFKEGKTILPLMGPKGCEAAPHFRPSCTLHTCQINSLGIKLHDPEWTEKYFELREKLNELELEKYENLERNSADGQSTKKDSPIS